MGPASAGLRDVIFRLIRSARDEAEIPRLRHSDVSAAGGPGSPMAYTVLVYSDLELDLDSPTQVSPPFPVMLAGLPLAGVERLEVGWSSYEDYLADFLQGEKAPEVMRHRLLHTLSAKLAEVVGYLSDQRVRLWLSSECPELDELPWELLLGEPGRLWETDLSFVRGLPPDSPRPLVPVQGKPRLALIGSPPFAPGPLWDRLQALQDVEVVALSGDWRRSLRQAVADGFELVHLVADGFITQAYEAALYYHDLQESDPARQTLFASELGSHLFASQVAVLGLTVPDYHSPDVITVAGRKVPSAYRAYARLGATSPSLPTIVAPIGPLDPSDAWEVPRLVQFWGEFYEGVGKSYNAENGMRRARNAVKGAPVALFLRHPHGLFRRAEQASARLAVEVAQKGAEYALSRRFTDRLRTFQQSGGFSDNLIKLLDEESVHQNRIASELEPWTRREEKSE